MSETPAKTGDLASEATGKLKLGVGGAAGSKEDTAKGQAAPPVGESASQAEAPQSAEPADRETRIRMRAYYIWQAEGFPDGREHDHWRQAEEELERQEAELDF